MVGDALGGVPKLKWKAEMPPETRDATGLIWELHCGMDEPCDGGAATVAFNAKPYGLDDGHVLGRELASEVYLKN
jgi:hypothetical protein